MSEAAENVEALVQEAYAPEASPEVATEGIIAEAQPETEVVEESSSEPSEGGRTIKYKGKELSLDDDKYQMFAQKGYDYEQKMHQFKVDRKLFEQEKEKELSEFKELKAINDYAKENPAFEQLIQQHWAKVQAGEELKVAPEDRVQVLESRLNQIVERLESQGKEVEARRLAEMEAKQEMAIEKYKEQYSDFDWSTKDDNGSTLEDRIMQSMIDNGVKNFEIMADSFLMKEHMNRKALEGKETVAKGVQKANKLGLGKVTKKSQLGAKKAEDVSSKSYDDLVSEGLRELGIEF